MSVPKPVRAALVLVAACAALPFSVTAQAPASVGAAEHSFDGEFTSITAVRELADGRLLVLDAEAQELRAVDLERGRWTPVGRRGRGPEEYLQPGGLYPTRRGDIVVTDRAQRRHLVVTANGRIVRSEPFEVAGTAMSLNASPWDTYVLDGEGRAYSTRFVFTRQAPDLAEGVSRDTLPLLRYSARGERFDTVATLVGPERTVRWPSPGMMQSRTTAFSSQDAFGVARDGSVAVVRAEPYRVEWVGADGRVAAGPAYPVERIPVTARDREAANTRAQAASRRMPASIQINGQRQPVGTATTELRFAEFKPPFQSPRALVSDANEVWVQRTGEPDATGVLYDVFDRRGERVRQLLLPPRSRVVGVGPSKLYVARLDDDDVPHLERYALPPR